jgi:opacity protein-like surface antigen
MARNIIWQLVLVLILFPASALAQSPVTAVYRPVVTAGLGYSYVSLPVAPSTRLGLNGASASITAEFRSRFGVKADFNYVLAENVFGTGHNSYVLSYMLGPLFYPVRSDRLIIYVQALAGNSRVSGIVPNGAGGVDTGNTTGPSWAIGAGIERAISPSLAIRTETDYLHTTFLDSNAFFLGQSDLRITTSLVYRWGGISEVRRYRRHF